MYFFKSRNFLLFFVFVLFIDFSEACGISPQTEISVLTLKPGEELYSIFGHTALRIRDPLNNNDFVYNFGVFDFDEKNFYLRFILGKLHYRMSKYPFENMLYEAVAERRSLYEQKLVLPFNVKQEMVAFLDSLDRSGYRYSYEFFRVNCATKIIHVLDTFTNYSIRYSFKRFPDEMTFRSLIAPYIQHRPVISTGINLLLGPAADKKTEKSDYFFLPDYIMTGLEGAERIINDTTIMLSGKPVELYSIDTIRSPGKTMVFFISILFLFSVAILSITGYIRRIRYFVIDYFFLLLSGMPGLLLVFLWMASDHAELHRNLNILWANPLNVLLFFLFLMRKKFSVVAIFILFCLILYYIVYLAGIQYFPFPLLVLSAVIFIRLTFALLQKDVIQTNVKKKC